MSRKPNPNPPPPPEPIDGFTIGGRKYRVTANVEHPVALDLRAEADAKGMDVATVAGERIAARPFGKKARKPKETT